MAEGTTVSELVCGVYILGSPYYQSKRGLILDDAGSILLDTSVSRTETQMLIDKSIEMEKPIRRIVLTDWHFDHSAWCELVPDTERIAPSGAREGMLSQHAKDYLASDPPEHPDLKQFTITPPTIELDGPGTMYLHERQLQLFPTPGHSFTHQSALLLPDGVLFAGDAVITCFPPVIQDGDSNLAMDTFQKIMGMEFKWLVPGHGPILNHSEAKQHIKISQDYLQTMQERISQFDDPDTPIEEVKSAVKDLPAIFSPTMEMVEDWHQRAVMKVWDECRLERMGGVED